MRNLTFLIAILLASPAFADDAAARLTDRGVKLKTSTAGVITEVAVPQATEMTLDDYKLLGQFKDITQAHITATKVPFNDEAAAVLTGWDKVEVFFANGAELTDDGFKSIAQWKSLRQFGLDHWGWKNPGKTLYGPGLADLAALPNLQIIRLGGCRIDDHGAAALAKIKTLQSVDVQHCATLTDDGVADLATLPDLRIIKLNPQNTPRIADPSLAHLGHVKTLEEIEIAETLLTYEAGFSHLKALTGLKKITLRNVVAADADIDLLKADHPSATITWTKPEDAVAEKTKALFKSHAEKQKAK